MWFADYGERLGDHVAHLPEAPPTWYTEDDHEHYFDYRNPQFIKDVDIIIFRSSMESSESIEMQDAEFDDYIEVVHDDWLRKSHFCRDVVVYRTVFQDITKEEFEVIRYLITNDISKYREPFLFCIERYRGGIFDGLKHICYQEPYSALHIGEFKESVIARKRVFMSFLEHVKHTEFVGKPIIVHGFSPYHHFEYKYLICSAADADDYYHCTVESDRASSILFPKFFKR